MTNHARTPETGTANAPPFPINDNLTPHLSRTLHLTLEHYSAYVVLERLVSYYGFHEVLNDPWLICWTLRCTAEHWHDNIAPAIVPILEIWQEEAA